MFTGIVQSIGTILEFHPDGNGAKLTIDTALSPDILRQGDSIAVDGCCQTIEQARGSICIFHALHETLSRTIFKSYKKGSHVNIEPALSLGERLGGHLVQGHIDCTARILKISERKGDTAVTLERPTHETFPMVEKGSVAINGISLTVAEVTDSTFTVCIIPHTWKHTSLQDLSQGSAVNLEADIIGKYVSSLFSPYTPRHEITLDMMKDAGF